VLFLLLKVCVPLHMAIVLTFPERVTKAITTTTACRLLLQP
jgi:hypothetical protein